MTPIDRFCVLLAGKLIMQQRGAIASLLKTAILVV